MVAGSFNPTTSSPTAIKSSFRSVPPSSSVSASSPPLASAGKPTSTPQYAMNAAAFVPPSHPYQTQAGMPFGSNMSPMTDASSAAPGSCAILIRKLARNMTEKELRSMFLFAKDFIDSEFIAPETQDDQGYVSALARFKTSSAASEAKAMLDGKPNTATEANMIVEILQGSTSQPQGSRRNTYDGSVNRGPSSSTSSTASSNGAGGARQASRYNGTFQTMERISPTGTTSTLGGVNAQPNGDFPAPETGSHFQNLFSPQSPINNQAERPRVSGKSVINDDSVDDDETGELLKDPVAYAKNGNGTPSNASTRRQTNSQPPVSRFAGLSLATSNMTSPPTQGFASPRGGMPMQSPTSAGPSASMANLGPNASYQLSAQHFQRPNYPPVNPADQNPPCNTLYVGNLPIDTSEDELKAMFSKQRGYKRLCFRTKQNGPMCFVEFEDVSFATKALNELYGHPLHNSVKGGIRLSFSKNPLGVRTGQSGTVAGLPSPATPHSAIQGMNGLVGGASGQPFATANGPPPGLAAPPGLNSPVSGINNPPMNGLTGPINGSMINGAYSGTFGMAGNGMNGMRGSSMGGGIATAGHGSTMQGVDGGFPEYMMGR